MKPINIVGLVGLLATGLVLGASGQANVNPDQLINLEKIESFAHFLQSSLEIRAEVSFIDNDRLAVTFLNPCPERPIDQLRLKDREKDKKPCGLVVTVLLVDTKTSQIQQSLALPFHLARQSKPSAVEGFRLLLPTEQGEFVIHTGDFLLRFGPNLELIERRPISNPDRTVVFVSPSGRLILLNEYEDVGKFHKFVFPARNIQGGKLFGVGWPAQGVMDDGSVLSRLWTADLLNPKSSDSLRIKSGRDKCHVDGLGFCEALCVSEDECHILGPLQWRIDDTKFAMRIAGMRNTKQFAVVDRSGKKLYVGSTSYRVSHFATGAGTAQRLVIMSGEASLSGMTQFGFDVLDMRDMKIVLKARLSSAGIKHGGWIMMRRPDAAVSPDGSRIAILVGSELRLYQLPAEQTSRLPNREIGNLM